MITPADITTALDSLLALRKRYPLAAMPFIALCPFPCNGRIIGLCKFGEPIYFLCERCRKPVSVPSVTSCSNSDFVPVLVPATQPLTENRP